LSAGAGAKGPRLYDWARVPIRLLSEPGRYWLLVRRSRTDGELAPYLCFCPPEAALADLVAVAGARWAIEESFQTAKGESAWTTTRSAATTPGTGTSPWPASPTPT
jgi:hypothetical protein